MKKIMNQQRLLLEWLIMAGNIAVSDTDDSSILYATQTECEKAGWITLTPFGSGFFMAAITASGKTIVKDRRSARGPNSGPNRRRELT